MPRESSTPEEQKAPADSLPEGVTVPEDSATEMIDRNRFLLHQLQSELGRLREELASRKLDPPGAAGLDPGATPEEILEETRTLLEKFQAKMRHRKSDQADGESGEGSKS
ncbi:MAG: hypothetical protein O7H41_20860 [Planctomycetota bacterium]|nr:hypothetical protein [Planctomycetota bacterium]